MLRAINISCFPGRSLEKIAALTAMLSDFLFQLCSSFRPLNSSYSWIRLFGLSSIQCETLPRSDSIVSLASPDSHCLPHWR